MSPQFRETQTKIRVVSHFALSSPKNRATLKPHKPAVNTLYANPYGLEFAYA
jgi:hypothetical protein